MRTCPLPFLFLTFFVVFQIKAQLPVPTWNDNISCIVQTHCAPCHNPDGLAPFSLQNYAEAAPLASLMSYMVENRLMPPWKPVPEVSHFVGERLLTRAEIKLISRWALTGATEGDTSMSLPIEVFENKWQIPNPDLSLRMEEFTIPVVPPGKELHQCFVLKTGLTEDKIIKAIEFVPGSRNAVHHAHVSMDLTNSSWILDSLYPGPGYRCENIFNPIYTYGPSADALFLPDGMGITLPVGADIVINLHYPDAAGLVDSSRVNLLFTDEDSTREVYNAAILDHNTNMLNGPLFIPADSIRTFYERTAIPKNVSLLAIFPHGHRILDTISSIAILPDGQRINLVHIDNWDPGWQGYYAYPKPVILPAGTQVWGRAVYNNTADNPGNPFDPPQDMDQTGGSLGEMMVFGFIYADYEPGDESIIIDSMLGTSYYMGCDPLTGTPKMELPQTREYFIQPNPAIDHIQVITPGADPEEQISIQLFDLSGREVLTEFVNGNSSFVSLPAAVPSGLYLYVIKSESFHKTGKLIVLR